MSLSENVLGKLTDLRTDLVTCRSQSDLVRSQSDLVRSQSEMEDRLSNQQTVLAKETALALQKLEEGQGNLVYSQTAEVAEIVHRLNTLERSRASSRVRSREASPDPYLSGTATQIPGLSAGALFPQDHLVNRSVNPNSTTDAPIFSTSVCEGPDTLSLGPRRIARLQSVVSLWCKACAYTGRYTDAFYRKQRLDRVLDSLHFRSYSVGFYYPFFE